MGHFKYKVIPAPRNGVRTKGAKGPAGRYAGALENAINVLASEGWEYLRAESLPMDERQGLTMRKTETYQNVLIFRKAVEMQGDAISVPVEMEDQNEAEDVYYDINDDYLNDEDGIVIEDDDAEDEKDDTKA